MSQTSATTLITAEELLVRSNEFGRCELIDGRVIALGLNGCEHGQIVLRVGTLIDRHVSDNGLGISLASGTGFVIRRQPDSVRSPDFAFVQLGRIPPNGTNSYFEGGPDLVVEVNSPVDKESDVLEKVDDWIASGVQSCWVVDPKTRSVLIHRVGGSVSRHKVGDTMDNEPTLPGLVLKVAELFED